MWALYSEGGRLPRKLYVCYNSIRTYEVGIAQSCAVHTCTCLLHMRQLDGVLVFRVLALNGERADVFSGGGC